MKITITKKDRRNRLACHRHDGTCEIADLGPALPHHDLAHFVVERHLDLKDGFFGRIAQGYSVVQLSTKETIQSSPPESLIAEIAARALQALSADACRSEQLAELVNVELSKWRIPPITIPLAMVDRMRVEFQELVNRFDALAPGEALHLELELECGSASSSALPPRTRSQ